MEIFAGPVNQVQKPDTPSPCPLPRCGGEGRQCLSLAPPRGERVGVRGPVLSLVLEWEAIVHREAERPLTLTLSPGRGGEGRRIHLTLAPAGP
jgi:hypothetical protein